MNRRVFIFWAIFGGAAIIRLIFSFNIQAPDIGNCLKQQIKGVGVITEDPSFTDTGQVLVVEAERLSASQALLGNVIPPTDSDVSPAHGNFECPSGILIRMKTKLYPRFLYGDTISFTGKLLVPMNFASGTGRPFDYRNYLAKDDIFYEMKSAVVAMIVSDSFNDNGTNGESRSLGNYFNRIESIANLTGNAITSSLLKLKRGFVNNLNSALGEPHSALAAGLVVGEKAALGNDLLNDFRTVGLIHIVVLSGFNITIVADALRRLLSRLPRVWGIVVGGIGIALFGILVGGGATVVRSCFMAGIALSANMFRRDYNVIRALAFAACLMLIENPMILLHDPSFQLSFLATLGLILLASPIESKLSFIPEMFGLRGIIAATLSTQIFVSPFILYMMGQLSIIGVVVNILVLPFIPVTMLAVFLTGASGYISTLLCHVFGWGAHLLLAYELFMVEHFARLPFAAVYLPQFSGWWVLGFYGVFLAGFVAVKRWGSFQER
jgi:competence protein ComEC